MIRLGIFPVLLFCAIALVTAHHDSTESPDSPVVRSKFDFAVSLMRQLIPAEKKDSEIKKNIILSAPNIFSAFLTLYLGTDGPSKDQLAKALHIEGLEDSLILDDRKHRTASNTSFEADRLYHDNTVVLKKPFLDQVKDQVRGVDFQGTPSGVTADINQWVSDKTLGRIPKLFNEPLSPDTRVLIVSTIYFKSRWAVRFLEEETKKDTFTNHKGEVKQVNMMHQKEHFRYDDSDVIKSQIIALPYTDRRYSFVIFLPRAGQQTIGQLIDKLTVDTVRDSIKNLQEAKVDIKIPKFKVKREMDLKQVFRDLKVTDVFDSGKANLERMTDEKVYVSEASHVATIEVDEHGTIAAAVTFGKLEALSIDITAPKHFTADHPFVYMIYDDVNKLPIFTGVMVDPS